MSSSVDNDSQLPIKTNEVDLPITSQTIFPAGYIGAIILNVATSVFLAVITRYDILFQASDLKIDDHTTDKTRVQTISNETRAYYTASITLFATLLSAFSVGQIKQLWLKRNSALGSNGISTKLREYNATLIGLSSTAEKFRVWEISLVLMISGLGTTAIVTGLTPTLIVHSTPTVGHLGWLSGSNDWPGSPDCFQRDNETSSHSDWSWKLGDQSFLSLVPDPTLKHCAPDRVWRIMSSESLLDTYYIMVGGVAVHRSALGLPYLQFSNGFVKGGFGEYFGSSILEHRNAGFRWVTRCLPVLTQNPVKCRQSDSYVTNDSTPNVIFRVESTGCSLTLPTTSTPTGMIKDQRAGRACPESQEPGKISLLFGAVGNNSALKFYDLMHGDVNSNYYNPHKGLDWSFEASDKTPADWEAMEHRKKIVQDFRTQYPHGYGVSCDVNIEPSIGYKLLTLTSENAAIAGGEHSASLAIYGGDSCEPELQNGVQIQDLQSFLRTDEALAAGAGAAASLLRGAEANLTTLMDSMNLQWGSKTRSFFEDSTNTFEDNLGVASAIALGMHWGVSTSIKQLNITNGELAMARTRVGSKDAKAILCILPSVFTALILVILAVDEFRRSNAKKRSSTLAGITVRC